MSDLRRPAEPGWREIATAPRDGTFVRLERFGRIGGYVTPEIGQWAGGIQRREFENDEELGVKLRGSIRHDDRRESSDLYAT